MTGFQHGVLEILGDPYARLLVFKLHGVHLFLITIYIYFLSSMPLPLVLKEGHLGLYNVKYAS